MITGKEARKDAIGYWEDNENPVVSKFSDWVTQQASMGYFEGTLDTAEYEFTKKDLGFLKKMGFKIDLDSNTPNQWQIEW